MPTRDERAGFSVLDGRDCDEVVYLFADSAPVGKQASSLGDVRIDERQNGCVHLLLAVLLVLELQIRVELTQSVDDRCHANRLRPFRP